MFHQEALLKIGVHLDIYAWELACMKLFHSLQEIVFEYSVFSSFAVLTRF